MLFWMRYGAVHSICVILGAYVKDLLGLKYDVQLPELSPELLCRVLRCERISVRDEWPHERMSILRKERWTSDTVYFGIRVYGASNSRAEAWCKHLPGSASARCDLTM